jgi:hypothetical protein
MNPVIIDKKKYVILPIKEYNDLQKNATLNVKSERLLSIKDARDYTNNLINKWSKEK